MNQEHHDDHKDPEEKKKLEYCHSEIHYGAAIFGSLPMHRVTSAA
jgi:hypothetical protein